MTLDELKEEVAHYCDEEQVENEGYFFTAVNGVIKEILQRFPIVRCYTHRLERKDSQTTVNMDELVDDFASFSTPAYTAETYPPAAPLIDGRCGQVIFPSGCEGEIRVYYNKKIPSLDRDSDNVPFEGERLQLLILGTAYRLLLIDESYDAAKSVKTLYDETAYFLESNKRGADMRVKDVTGW